MRFRGLAECSSAAGGGLAEAARCAAYLREASLAQLTAGGGASPSHLGSQWTHGVQIDCGRLP